VVRAAADRVEPGGKGVNVSRAVAAAGHRTVAVLPLGGADSELLERLLTGCGVEVAPVRVSGRTRVNVSAAEPDGTLTKINAPGPVLAAADSGALLDAVAARAADASWTACCGSLPGGLDDDWYAHAVTRARRAGSRVALDASGPALRRALAARPDVVKPNAEELAEAAGHGLATVGDAVRAAELLRAAGAGAVLASLGADGQLLVEAGGVYFGTAPAPAVRSDVGAGDASLAGFLTAGGTGPAALASALAHGVAAVGLPGTAMPTPADLRPDTVTVTADVPAERPLSARR
jgi:1-phosphofructokinase